MKVAIDISPTLTAHSSRGIGVYTKNLLEELQKIDEIEIVPFENPKKPPKADLIHCPYFDLFFHTLPIFCKTPRLITIHDVIPLVFPQHFPFGKKGKVNLFLQKLALKNSKGIICDSETSKNDIANKLHYPLSGIHVVYLAPGKIFKEVSDRKLLNLTKQKYKLPQEYVLYVGDVNWNKNLPNLLKAIKLSNYNLVLVGKALVNNNLDQVREINSLIEELNIGSQIQKLGYVPDEDLVNIYNLAEVTIVPSHYEGFGLPVVESMACGTPVICANNSSLAEIGGEAAIYCNPDDPKDIADKINSYILSDKTAKEERRKMSQEQATKFNWKRTGQKVIKIYKTFFK